MAWAVRATIGVCMPFFFSRSRLLLLAAFGLPLLGATFLLGRAAVGTEHGVRTGTVLALAVGLSFSAVPYLPIVQTDAAAALGFTLVA